MKKHEVPWALALVAFGLMVAIGIVSGILGFRFHPVVMGAVIVVTMVAINRTATRRVEKRIRRLVSSHLSGDLTALARKAVMPSAWVGRDLAVTTVAAELARRGCHGETLRIQWQKTFPPVEPLTVTFEPRLLDEADSAFEELRVAVAPAQDSAGRASPPARSDEDTSVLRQIKRTSLLRGGWPFVVMIVIFSIRPAVESYQRGTITPGLLFWTSMLLLMLLGPARGGWFDTKQWLLAPGGLFVRKARWRDRTCTLYLFDRRKSVLCAHRRTKHQWLLVVSDGAKSEQTLATSTEVLLLLRAWLSPLEPPPAERLADLR